MRRIFQKVQNKCSFLNNILINFWKSWLRSSSSLKREFQNIKWKNDKAKPGCAYKPTEIEQHANVITHGVWILPSILATIELYRRSKSSGQLLVALIYGGALTMLFSVSTFFHCCFYCSNQNGLKDILHRCDRAMIYVFIAGSYFPWLQLENTSNSTILLCLEWIIWFLAVLGIAYQQVFHERFKCLETCFYIIMGLGPALAVILSGHEFPGMNELKLGGFFYIIGICFFKSDGIIPMAHAIWHLFVAVAAGFHYYAILLNLYPKESIFVSNK